MGGITCIPWRSAGEVARRVVLKTHESFPQTCMNRRTLSNRYWFRSSMCAFSLLGELFADGAGHSLFSKSYWWWHNRKILHYGCQCSEIGNPDHPLEWGWVSVVWLLAPCEQLQIAISQLTKSEIFFTEPVVLGRWPLVNNVDVPNCCCLLWQLQPDIMLFLLQVVYDMDSGHLNLQIFASNFIPLWCGVLAPGQCSPPSHISCQGTSMVLRLNSALQLLHGWYYSRGQCQQLGCHV